MARAGGPITVCVINLKGGVGKSTIAALLARRAYTDHGLDVLAIDLDPQANLSQGLMHNDYKSFLTQKRPSVVEVFNGFIPPTTKTAAAKPLLPNPTFEIVASARLGLFSSSRRGSIFRIICWALYDPTRKRLLDICPRTSSTRISLSSTVRRQSQSLRRRLTTPAGWFSFQSNPNILQRLASPCFSSPSTTLEIRIADRPSPSPASL